MRLDGLLQRETFDRKKLERILAEDTSGACGIAAIQSARGATHEVVDLLLRSICDNDIRAGIMEEKRGPHTGDGAGISLRTDNDEAGHGMQDFLRSHVGREVPLTRPGEQLHGSIFFIDAEQRTNVSVLGQKLQAIFAAQGFSPLVFRKVPINTDAVSARARAIMPLIYELVYAEGDVLRGEMRRTLFDTRLKIKEGLPDTHPVSLQPGTMTWKGMLRGQDLASFYPELRDPRLTTDGGLSHTRFGTNVLAHWRLAQPFDLLGHNGEVNSIRVILEALHVLERRNSVPGTNIMRGGSDSANLDRALQMLHARAGLSLPEAVRFIIHPAQDDLENLDPKTRHYFRAVARALGSLKAIGPIALLAMDRDHITATLDNMGLRPLRWVQRDDGLIVVSSEVGSPRIDPARIVEYGRLGPGEHIYMDRSGRLRKPGDADSEIIVRTKLNFEDFASRELLPFSDVVRRYHAATTAAGAEAIPTEAREAVIRKAHLFGLNKQRFNALRDTIEAKKDPVEGMGSDLAISALVPEPHSLAKYFRPDYAQVTNPSLDPVRNRGAFSLTTHLGRKPKQKEFARTYEARSQYELEDPLLDDEQMEALYATDSGQRPAVLRISTVCKERGPESMKERLSEIKAEVLRAAELRTHSIIVLNDREARPSCSEAKQLMRPEGATLNGDSYIPPHLAVSYLTRALADAGLSEFVSFVVDTGEVLDQHEYATLISCGAHAVHPRMIFELAKAGYFGKKSLEEVRSGSREGFNFTLLRYMSKLGITEVEEYRGGRQFSTLGLDTAFVNRYFGDIPTNGGGFGLDRILKDQSSRAAFDPRSMRAEDERHAYAKAVWTALQEVGESHAQTPEEAYRKYLEILEAQGPLNFRDLLRLKIPTNGKRKPIPLEQVMSREEIIKRVLRGASMSLGALNDKSHYAISLLFNMYDSYSCSGEGGVSPETKRGRKWEGANNGARQIASGRFGVDIEYLADPRVRVIEIKIGQGAKPGVGGHLPGEKVAEMIAEVRGVGLGQELISPPTNHNIYSIEDLAAFIGHLKACNPVAKISVKITAGANVGNIAVGCVKAGANMVQVSGDQGGTGAATYTDKFNTGLPTELGVSNIDRALIERGLREKTTLGADGGVRTGLDVLKLIMLGADDVALGTAILIAQQKCVFCSSCSFQTCPSHICRTSSTFLGEDKKNRIGFPDDEKMRRLIDAGSHFLELMAEEIRGYLAQMGVKDIDELQGRRDLLEVNPKHADLAKHFDLKTLLEMPEPVFQPLIRMPTIVDRTATRLRRQTDRLLNPTVHDPEHVDYYLNHDAVNEPNRELIRAVASHPFGSDDTVRVSFPLTTQDRSVGATLSGLVVKEVVRLPKRGIIVDSHGEAGQGYGYAIGDRITMRHRGVVQNETGEIQSGGRIVVMPPDHAHLRKRNDLPLVGNTLGYGARGGDRFIQASIGDRGCVRQTGGRTIITGNTGKYFSEYQTGGCNIVLGEFFGEVGPGMSGGETHALDSNLRHKLSGDAMITPVLRRRDLERIRADLLDFHAETDDDTVARMLVEWKIESRRFQKVVARGQYATSVFQWLYQRSNRPSRSEATSLMRPKGATLGEEVAPERRDNLIADLLEMCGYDIDTEDTGRIPLEDMQVRLDAEFQALQDAVARLRKSEEPEQVFMFTRRFAAEATARIFQRFAAADSARTTGPETAPFSV